MTNPRDLENEKDDRDLEIGRPHGPREDEEERSSPVSRDDEDKELRDEDVLFDDDDLADDGDLDIEPDDDAT